MSKTTDKQMTHDLAVHYRLHIMPRVRLVADNLKKRTPTVQHVIIDQAVEEIAGRDDEFWAAIPIATVSPLSDLIMPVCREIAKRTAK